MNNLNFYFYFVFGEIVVDERTLDERVCARVGENIILLALRNDSVHPLFAFLFIMTFFFYILS